MCLVAFQKMFRKIFSDVWLCSSKYHRKHIFYLLLTFSLIFSVAKRIYNIIHSSKHKQNVEKNHQVRTLRAIVIAIEASRDCDRRFARSAWCRWSRRTILVDDFSGRSRWSWRSKLWTISASSALDDLYSLFFLSPSLSFSRSLSLFCAWPENGLKVKWQCKTISGLKE